MVDKDRSFVSHRAGRWLSGIVTLLFFFLVQPATLYPIAAEGQNGEPSAIDFQAADLDGGSFDGLDLKGNIVLLDFWAVWCKPCLDAFPKLYELKADLADEDFQIVSIASYSGTAGDVKQFLQEYPTNYITVVGDEDLVYRYGVIGYPTYFLIDPLGDIYQKYVGDLPGLTDRIKSDVEGLEEKFGMR